MEKIKDFLAIEVGENTVQDFAIAVILFFVLFITFRLFKSFLVKKIRRFAERTKNEIDDELIKMIEGIKSVFYYVLALYFPLKTLVLPEVLERVVDGIFIVILIFQIIVSLQHLIKYGLNKWVEKNDGNTVQGKMAFAGIRLVINIILWIIGLILILSNLGINVTSLVASFGIGGIAVALAVQNILSDMISSFSIYFDKPFEIGDYIVVGEHDGVVKKVGLKTTRLQTLQGEELIISNNELTSTRIQNFKKMKRRRIVDNFGIVYEISMDKLKKVNEIIKSIINGIDGIDLDRCHFKEFGDYSLNFEVAYYVNSGDYSDCLDKRQELNFRIKEEFEKEGIDMAYPTSTTYEYEMRRVD